MKNVFAAHPDAKELFIVKGMPFLDQKVAESYCRDIKKPYSVIKTVRRKSKAIVAGDNQNGAGTDEMDAILKRQENEAKAAKLAEEKAAKKAEKEKSKLETVAKKKAELEKKKLEAAAKKKIAQEKKKADADAKKKADQEKKENEKNQTAE